MKIDLTARQQNLLGDVFGVVLITIMVASIAPLLPGLIAWAFWQTGRLMGLVARKIE